jgi:hypothetical protein
MDSNHTCLDGKNRPTKTQTTLDLEIYDIALLTYISHGHGVASKASGKYPQGTLSLQYPIFKELGLDLGHCYAGTLNLSIAPNYYKIHAARFNLKNVDWYPARGKTEDFLICDCAIYTENGYVIGYIYQPDPQTKIEHFDDPQSLQVISPFIQNLTDTKPICIYLCSSQIRII